jgi:hypothetical protein
MTVAYFLLCCTHRLNFTCDPPPVPLDSESPLPLLLPGAFIPNPPPCTFFLPSIIPNKSDLGPSGAPQGAPWGSPEISSLCSTFQN